jgi:hypothetical protein
MLQVVSMPAISSSRSVPGDILVIELPPIDARLGKKADQILARHLPAFGDFGGKERADLSDRALHDLLIGDAEFEKLVNPSAEQIAALWRNAKHGCNNANRNLLCVVDGAIGTSAASDMFEQFAADCPGLRLVASDRFRRKRRQQ